jgi:hypothetical protein
VLASAYATAKPRAPDGLGIRTAVASRNDLRIAASREAAISLRDATQGAARIGWNSQRTPKNNAPGTASEGIRASSEDRVTDLPLAGTGQSMESRPSYAQRANEPASRIGCASLRLSAMWLRVADISEIFFVVFLREVREEGAHLTAEVANAQAIFLKCDERLVWCARQGRFSAQVSSQDSTSSASRGGGGGGGGGAGGSAAPPTSSTYSKR